MNISTSSSYVELSEKNEQFQQDIKSRKVVLQININHRSLHFFFLMYMFMCAERFMLITTKTLHSFRCNVLSLSLKHTAAGRRVHIYRHKFILL